MPCATFSVERNQNRDQRVPPFLTCGGNDNLSKGKNAYRSSSDHTSEHSVNGFSQRNTAITTGRDKLASRRICRRNCGDSIESDRFVIYYPTPRAPRPSIHPAPGPKVGRSVCAVITTDDSLLEYLGRQLQSRVSILAPYIPPYLATGHA
jgi:hypothetical protein